MEIIKEIEKRGHGDGDRMQKVECHQCGGMYFKVSRMGRGEESCGVCRVECDRGLSEVGVRMSVP